MAYIPDGDVAWLNHQYLSPLTGFRDLGSELVRDWGYDPADHPGLLDALEVETTAAFIDAAHDVMRQHGLDGPTKPLPTAAARDQEHKPTETSAAGSPALITTATPGGVRFGRIVHVPRDYAPAHGGVYRWWNLRRQSLVLADADTYEVIGAYVPLVGPDRRRGDHTTLVLVAPGGERPVAEIIVYTAHGRRHGPHDLPDSIVHRADQLLATCRTRGEDRVTTDYDVHTGNWRGDIV